MAIEQALAAIELCSELESDLTHCSKSIVEAAYEIKRIKSRLKELLTKVDGQSLPLRFTQSHNFKQYWAEALSLCDAAVRAQAILKENSAQQILQIKIFISTIDDITKHLSKLKTEQLIIEANSNNAKFKKQKYFNKDLGIYLGNLTDVVGYMGERRDKAIKFMQSTEAAYQEAINALNFTSLKTEILPTLNLYMEMFSEKFAELEEAKQIQLNHQEKIKQYKAQLVDNILNSTWLVSECNELHQHGIIILHDIQAQLDELTDDSEFVVQIKQILSEIQPQPFNSAISLFKNYERLNQILELIEAEMLEYDSDPKKESVIAAIKEKYLAPYLEQLEIKFGPNITTGALLTVEKIYHGCIYFAQMAKQQHPNDHEIWQNLFKEYIEAVREHIEDESYVARKTKQVSFFKGKLSQISTHLLSFYTNEQVISETVIRINDPKQPHFEGLYFYDNWNFGSSSFSPEMIWHSLAASGNLPDKGAIITSVIVDKDSKMDVVYYTCENKRVMVSGIMPQNSLPACHYLTQEPFSLYDSFKQELITQEQLKKVLHERSIKAMDYAENKQLRRQFYNHKQSENRVEQELSEKNISIKQLLAKLLNVGLLTTTELQDVELKISASKNNLEALNNIHEHIQQIPLRVSVQFKRVIAGIKALDLNKSDIDKLDLLKNQLTDALFKKNYQQFEYIWKRLEPILAKLPKHEKEKLNSPIFKLSKLFETMAKIKRQQQVKDIEADLTIIEAMLEVIRIKNASVKAYIEKLGVKNNILNIRLSLQTDIIAEAEKLIYEFKAKISDTQADIEQLYTQCESLRTTIAQLNNEEINGIYENILETDAQYQDLQDILIQFTLNEIELLKQTWFSENKVKAYMEILESLYVIKEGKHGMQDKLNRVIENLHQAAKLPDLKMIENYDASKSLSDFLEKTQIEEKLKQLGSEEDHMRSQAIATNSKTYFKI